MSLSCLVRLLVKILCFALFLGIESCASVSHQSMPEEGSAQLSLLKQKCTLCHGLPHPKRHTANEWDHLLVLMTERMNEKNISYTSEEMTQIKSYLQRNAR
jgi:hypothetical protein